MTGRGTIEGTPDEGVVAVGTTTTTTPELGALDRCDRCGARAKAVLETGSGDLLFCGHCAAKHCPDRVRWAGGEPHPAGKP